MRVFSSVVAMRSGLNKQLIENDKLQLPDTKTTLNSKAWYNRILN